MYMGFDLTGLACTKQVRVHTQVTYHKCVVQVVRVKNISLLSFQTIPQLIQLHLNINFIQLCNSLDIFIPIQSHQAPRAKAQECAC